MISDTGMRDDGSVGGLRSTDWLPSVMAQLQEQGFALVTGVLNDTFMEATRAAMYQTSDRIRHEVGADRLERAGELGVLRCMPKFDPLFLGFLEIPEALAVIDATVGPTAILHTQNGFILPSIGSHERKTIFQTTFHRDFPRYLGGFVASVNIMFAIDAFREENGATIVAPGTHQLEQAPTEESMHTNGIAVECPAGSMFVFDSTLWHAAGQNRSGHDRVAINHQFTRSFIKQQIDYVRLLGDDVIKSLAPRTQQLLGWYTRVVTSLDEYYRAPAERLYRSGQG